MATKVLLYRPGSQRPLVVAFAAAAAVHLCAVALASFNRQPVPIGSPDFTVIDVEAENDDATVPPESAELPPSSEVKTPEDFVESQAPPRQMTKQTPTRSPRTAAVKQVHNGKAFARNAPRPEYPYEARSRHITGSGVAILTINPTTGLVVNASMEQSTGNAILDHSALAAFRRWEFQSGTPATVRIPVTFTITGVAF